MVTLRTTRAGMTRDRQFKNLAEAAKFGVAYYLTDNDYADRAEARPAADKIRKGDPAECNGIRFEILP